MSDESLNILVTGDASGAVNAIDQLDSRLRSFAQESVNHLTTLAAEVFGLKAAFEGVKEGILKGDEIRDLGNSLTVFTGSTKAATEAMRFFEEQATHTRNTGEELAKTFRDVLPLAISRGFSQQTLEHVTVWLSQLATVSGRTLDDMESGFRRLLSGRVDPARNPLLQVLGFNKGNVQDLNWDDVFSKMEQRADAGAKVMGQSFESAFHKAKDDLLRYMGEGINEVNERNSLADNMLKTVESPDSVETFHNIGRFIGELLKGDIVAALSTTDLDKILGKKNSVTFGQSSLIPDLYDASNPAPGSSVADELNIGRNAVRQAGIQDITGYGGSWGDFLVQFGKDLEVHKDKAKEIIAAIRDEVHGGVLAWTDYGSSEKWVLDGSKPLNEGLAKTKTGLGGVALGAKQAKDGLNDLSGAMSGDKFLQRLGLSYGFAPSDMYEQRQGGIAYPGNYVPAGADFTDQRQQEFAMQFAEAEWKGAQKDAADKFAHEAIQKMQDGLQNDIANIFVDLGTKGGKNFGEVAGRAFNGLIAIGAHDLASKIVGFLSGGTPGDPSLGQDSKQFYDANGNVTSSTTRGKVAIGALGAAQVGFGAYSNTAAGGSRTAGTIGGGISGAGIGAEIGGSVAGVPGVVVGAVLGLIVGAIGSYLGAAAKRDQYQYGIPGVGANGQATFTDQANLTPAAVLQMQQSVQGTYDQYRNSYMRTLMTLGQGAPDLGSINGQFQPNASGHWGEHFQQWLSGTLPAEIAKQFQATMRTGFGSAGVSGTQFDAIWSKWSNLDPSKMAAMFDGLATVMMGLTKSTSYFRAGGASNYAGAQSDVNMTFAGSIQQSDTDILKFATDLKSLVGEDQINAAKQLNTMVDDRMNKEKQFLQDIIRMTEQAHQQINDARNSLVLQGMVKADGSPDLQAQAQFIRGMANNDLARLQGSKSVQDADQWLQRFVNDIQQVSSLGFSINTATGKDWNKWAQEQLGIGQAAFDQLAQNQQTDVQTVNAQFIAQFDPAVAGFVNSISNAQTAIGGVNDDLGRFHDGLGNAINKIYSFGAALDAMTKKAFAASTLAARVG